MLPQKLKVEATSKKPFHGCYSTDVPLPHSRTQSSAIRKY
jgi:hypothetical protein